MDDVQKKAKMLVGLYNSTKLVAPMAMRTGAYVPKPLTVEEAIEIIKDRRAKSVPLYFDYLNGRMIKVDLDNPNFMLYDRDNGPGAGETATLDELTRPE